MEKKMSIGQIVAQRQEKFVWDKLVCCEHCATKLILYPLAVNL